MGRLLKDCEGVEKRGGVVQWLEYDFSRAIELLQSGDVVLHDYLRSFDPSSRDVGRHLRLVSHLREPLRRPIWLSGIVAIAPYQCVRSALRLRGGALNPGPSLTSTLPVVTRGIAPDAQTTHPAHLCGLPNSRAQHRHTFNLIQGSK